MATQVSLTDGAVASAGALAIQTNGTTQAVSISTGQVATLAQNPILTSGTANGVAYLNGSKAVTSGSALTFDGSTLAVTGVVSATQSVADTSAIAVVASAATRTKVFGASGSTTAGMYGLLSNTGGSMLFGVENSGGGNVVTGSGAYSAYFGTNTNTPVSIAVNSTQVGVFDTSGNLGLGVTPVGLDSRFKNLEVGPTASLSSILVSSTSLLTYLQHNSYVDSSGATKFKYTGGSNYASQYNQNNGSHLWQTSTAAGTGGNACTFTTNMTLDASGNLGIGTSSPNSRLQVSNSSTSTNAIAQFTNGTTGTGAGNGLYVGVDTSNEATIFNFYNSALKFGTNGSERARIDSSGNLLVGTTTASAKITTTTSAAYQPAILASHTATDNSVRGISSSSPNFSGTDGYLYLGSAGGADKFYVRTSGNVQNTNNSYGAISDIKLKENITDATPKLAKLNQVRVVNYNLIGETQKQIGVVAQELEQIFPGMVEETPDRDIEGNDLGTTTKSVKYSVFVPMLIKALQEQQALITQLQADVAALKGA
jgi:Chaperone of endosialidase